MPELVIVFKMFWKIAFMSCLLAAATFAPVSGQGWFGWFSNLQGVFGRPSSGTTNATSTGILGGAKQIVNIVAGIKSSALQSVANATNQALDFGTNMTVAIPLVGSVVGLGTNVMKGGVNTLNAIGQAKINFFQNLKNAKLSMIERLVNATGNAFSGRPVTSSPRPPVTTNAPATTPATATTTATSVTTATPTTSVTPAAASG